MLDKNFMRVEQLADKNQFVIYNNSKVIFQSYSSVVAVYDKETKVLTLGRDWDYSHTTLKHLYIFLEENVWSVYRQIADVRNKRAKIQFLIESGSIQFDLDLR